MKARGPAVEHSLHAHSNVREVREAPCGGVTLVTGAGWSCGRRAADAAQRCRGAARHGRSRPASGEPGRAVARRDRVRSRCGSSSPSSGAHPAKQCRHTRASPWCNGAAAAQSRSACTRTSNLVGKTAHNSAALRGHAATPPRPNKASDTTERLKLPSLSNWRDQTTSWKPRFRRAPEGTL